MGQRYYKQILNHLREAAVADRANDSYTLQKEIGAAQALLGKYATPEANAAYDKLDEIAGEAAEDPDVAIEHGLMEVIRDKGLYRGVSEVDPDDDPEVEELGEVGGGGPRDAVDSEPTQESGPDFRRRHLDMVDEDLGEAAVALKDDGDVERATDNLNHAIEIVDKLQESGDEHDTTAELKDAIGSALHAESAKEMYQVTQHDARRLVESRRNEPDVAKGAKGPADDKARKLKALRAKGERAQRAIEVGKRGGKFYTIAGGKKVYVKE